MCGMCVREKEQGADSKKRCVCLCLCGWVTVVVVCGCMGVGGISSACVHAFCSVCVGSVWVCIVICNSVWVCKRACVVVVGVIIVVCMWYCVRRCVCSVWAVGSVECVACRVKSVWCVERSV